MAQRKTDMQCGKDTTIVHIMGALLIIILAVAIMLWASACRKGILPRQWFIGYRTPLTLRDPQAWINVNRASAPCLYIAGIGGLIAGISGAFFSLTDMNAVAAPVLGTGTIWCLAWTLLSFIPAARIERTYRRKKDRG